MARLPIDISTSGVRQNLPDAVFQPGSASPDAFGAGVGRSLQQLGEAGGQLSEKINQYAEREQKFDAQKRLIQATDADTQQASENQRNLTGNAAGYWQSQREQTRKNMDDFLATLPEGQRSEFAVKAESLVSARTQQAFAAQYQQSDANTKITLDEEARKAGLQVNQDPKAYDAALKSANDLIDASPLTPLEKTKRKAELQNSLAYTAETAAAQKDPAAVVAAGVGGGLRDKIRGKESGGNDTAQNPSSSARGRYQFLDSTWNSFAAKAGVPAVTADNKGTSSDPRNDGALQERVMDQYVAASTAELTSARLPVTDANLYLLHFMGQKGGVNFIRAMNNDASATAAAAFPGVADANKSVFYGGKDKTALSLSEVYNKLTSGLNGTGTTPSVVSAARANLTAAQTNAVDETARRSLVAANAAADTANQATQAATLNKTFIDLKEGPNPVTAYQEARKSGVLSDYGDIVKAEKIIADRNKGDDDLQVGLGLMAAGRSGANQLDKSHKDGIDAVYGAGIKAGVSPEQMAAATFDRTGIIPPSYALKMNGDIVSGDPTRMVSAAQTAANMLTQNPNALAGVEGKDRVEAAASEFNRLTGPLGMSPQEAGERMAADARTPKDAVKDEVLQKFKKDYLTVDKLDTRMHSQLSNWIGRGADQPVGPQRSAIASVYNELASEGFRQFQDPDKALAWADTQMKKQFGTQNGVITRYPPDKANLPSLEGKGTTWVNEQAAGYAAEQLGIGAIDPSQVALVPVARDGANTAQAFNAGGVDVKRNDSRPGQESTFRSVPYQIVVTPTADQIKAGASVQVVNGAYFPDLQTYVDKKNAEIKTTAKDVLYDANGVPYQVPAHAPELLQTPEQVSRRKQAEANAKLLDSQATERQRRVDEPVAVRNKSRELLSGGFGVPVDGQ